MIRETQTLAYGYVLAAWILLACLLGYPGLACAVWSDDPGVNTPVCSASGDQQGPVVTGDGAGGAIIAWTDYSLANPNIYVQRVDDSGAIQWGPGGVAITAFYDQQGPSITSDGAGGAIVAWTDARSSEPNIYAQRVDGSGSIQWAPNGIAITAYYRQVRPVVACDGSGGAIIAWEDGRPEEGATIYAQRVDASGVAKWTANGVILFESSYDTNLYPAILSDGAGGAIVMLAYWVSAMDTTEAQRISASGAVKWGPEGVWIMSNELLASSGFASDGAQGAIFALQAYRDGEWDICTQRVDASGSIQWQPDGAVVCSADHDQTRPAIASDGAGGAIIAWEDRRGGGPAVIYVQRVDASGAGQWTSNGVGLTAVYEQRNPQIISDGSGGAIIIWQEWRSGSYDLYAQRVNSSGEIQWPSNNVALCTAAGFQQNPVLISDDAGGVIVAWEDWRAGNADIYCQQAGKNGILGSRPPALPWLLLLLGK